MAAWGMPSFKLPNDNYEPHPEGALILRWQLGRSLFPSCHHCHRAWSKKRKASSPSCHYCSRMAALDTNLGAGGRQTHCPCQPVCSVVTSNTSLARCSVRSAIPAVLAAWRSVLAGWGPAARCAARQSAEAWRRSQWQHRLRAGRSRSRGMDSGSPRPELCPHVRSALPDAGSGTLPIRVTHE